MSIIFKNENGEKGNFGRQGDMTPPDFNAKDDFSKVSPPDGEMPEMPNENFGGETQGEKNKNRENFRQKNTPEISEKSDEATDTDGFVFDTKSLVLLGFSVIILLIGIFVAIKFRY